MSVAAAVVFLTADGLAQGGSARVSGSIVDQVGGLLPYVGVTLTNRRSMAHYEVRTDQMGHFEFQSLPAGEYLLEAQLAAFAPVEDNVTVSGGDRVQHDLTMYLAELQERITESDADPPVVTASSDARAAACERSAIGGDVQRPERVREVHPVYPARFRNPTTKPTELREPPDSLNSVRSAVGAVSPRTSTAIVVTGRLGTDGVLKDLRVSPPVERELAAATVDVLRQWQWTPLRLDCVTIDAPMTVTVDLSHR